MNPSLATELLEHEVYWIGSIVSQWGFLEADIFDQTLLSFADEEDLPKAMSNAQFSEILELWLERIVQQQQDNAKREVLKAQYDEIKLLSEYRQAVVHSRWEWRPDAPDVIKAVRVHKKMIKSVTFTVDDFVDFSIRLGRIRFSIRYPGGIKDSAEELQHAGGYISRLGWELLSGRRSLNDLIDIHKKS